MRFPLWPITGTLKQSPPHLPSILFCWDSAGLGPFFPPHWVCFPPCWVPCPPPHPPSSYLFDRSSGSSYSTAWLSMVPFGSSQNELRPFQNGACFQDNATWSLEVRKQIRLLSFSNTFSEAPLLNDNGESRDWDHWPRLQGNHIGTSLSNCHVLWLQCAGSISVINWGLSLACCFIHRKKIYFNESLPP